MILMSKPIIEKEEKRAVMDVMNSGMLVQGKKVKKLEELFAKLCGVKYAVAVNSGTSALHVALLAMGIGRGDEVITTPFTFIATSNAICMTGAKPVFVDIDEKTFNIDPSKIEAKISKKTKAILTVDLYGQAASYSEIKRIARKNKLFIIEDAAQAVNARYGEMKTGNVVDIATFSLYATKNIMSGEGGMVTTNSDEYYNRIKLLRHHGQDGNAKYEYKSLGYNYRMMDLNASIAIEQVKKINRITKRRREIAQAYDRAFKDIDGLIIPYVERNNYHVYHQYTLRVTSEFPLKRDELKNYLLSNGIQSEIYYPKPLYLFSHLGINHPLEITDKVSKEVLSIPVNSLLTNNEVRKIISTIKKI